MTVRGVVTAEEGVLAAEVSVGLEDLISAAVLTVAEGLVEEAIVEEVMIAASTVAEDLMD